MTQPKGSDLIAAIEKIIADAEADGNEAVELPTAFARALLEVARKTGRPRLTRSARIRESAFIAEARIQKQEMIDGGMSKEVAHEKAAEELQKKFVKLTRRRLSLSTIKRRMERSPRR